MIFINENDGIVKAQCEECGRILKFRKNTLSYNSQKHRYTLPEPVECFCENVSNTILNVPEQEQTVKDTASSVTPTKPVSATPVYSAPQPAQNVPRCPTCGSERVKKISFTSRAVSGYFLGVFGSNFSHTYECLNCGYKW